MRKGMMTWLVKLCLFKYFINTHVLGRFSGLERGGGLTLQIFQCFHISQITQWGKLGFIIMGYVYQQCHSVFLVYLSNTRTLNHCPIRVFWLLLGHKKIFMTFQQVHDIHNQLRSQSGHCHIFSVLGPVLSASIAIIPDFQTNLCWHQMGLLPASWISGLCVPTCIWRLNYLA